MSSDLIVTKCDKCNEIKKCRKLVRPLYVIWVCVECYTNQVK